jgi:Ca-activated chloride channel family protein
MRTILVSSLILTSTLIPFAAGEDGPRLLENNLRQTASAARPAASIRLDVNMTLVPVTVMDTMGHNVLGLSRENFRVFDGSEPRTIISFGRQDAPVSVGLVFDCSRSMKDKFKTAREAPAQLFQQLNPEDEAFLITVAERADIRQDFTSDFNEIRNKLLFTNPQGTTSLLDGVYLGLQHLKRAHNPKRALVIISDGGENNSRYTLRELAAMAQESDTQIFSICLFGDPKTREEQDGPELLSDLSLASGGVKFMITDLNTMQSAFADIGVTVHNQYVLGYYPPDNVPGGKYRKIKVQLLLPNGLPRLQIFARSGYYTPQQ